MKGDFSRAPFRAGHRYAAVLQQQGRVQLDSDWNEQSMITLELIRGVVGDVVGWHGGPPGSGFDVARSTKGSLTVCPGRYYVDGILVAGREQVTVDPVPPGAAADGDGRLVYLDVWERLVTAAEDPDLGDPALGGPDTTVRTDIACQVSVIWASPTSLEGGVSDRDRFVEMLAGSGGGRRPGHEPALTPDSGYSGMENRLYRVEIHDGGDLGTATMKWSRQNASVARRITGFEGRRVELAPSAGGSEASGFEVGDLVEVEASPTAQPGPGPLIRLEETAEDAVVLTDPVDLGAAFALRRWDGGPLQVGADRCELEDGIVVRFSGADYRTGDYWQFPARPGVGIIDWPEEEGVLQPRSPDGPIHHYAPLAFVDVDGHVVDLRRSFRPLADGDVTADPTTTSGDPSFVSLAFRDIPVPDFADVVVVPLPPGAPTDPTVWARAIFSGSDAPGWVRALLALRQALVGLIGVRRAGPSVFAVSEAVGEEALIATDDRHLDFRVAVGVDAGGGLVRVTTAVRLHGIRGRLYFAPVRLLHAPVVQTMTRRAARRIATTRH
ncbi:MAG: DUF2867 domain-containing protein [Acidimicrobiia bacterium]